MRSTRLIFCAILAAVCLPLVTGCKKESSTKVVYGTVTCAGERAETGQLRWVPIDDTPGPASMTNSASRRGAEFGALPSGYFWAVDHAVGKTVRLADAK